MDESLAVRQAKELHDAGIGKRMGTDKKTFIRILTQASRPQIKVWLTGCSFVPEGDGLGDCCTRSVLGIYDWYYNTSLEFHLR